MIVCFLHAKVGHCQAIYTKNPIMNLMGFFYARREWRGKYMAQLKARFGWAWMTRVGVACWGVYFKTKRNLKQESNRTTCNLQSMACNMRTFSVVCNTTISRIGSMV